MMSLPLLKENTTKECAWGVRFMNGRTHGKANPTDEKKKTETKRRGRDQE